MKRLCGLVLLIFCMTLCYAKEKIKLKDYHCQITLEDGQVLDKNPNDPSEMAIVDGAGRYVIVKCLSTSANPDPEKVNIFRWNFLSSYPEVRYSLSPDNEIDRSTSFISCSQRRTYLTRDSVRCYVVCYYAREYGYCFYSEDKDMLDEVLSNFYSSRRFFFKNYLSFVSSLIDARFNYYKWSHIALVFVEYFIYLIWCVCWFFGLISFCPTENVLWFFIKALILLNIFCYLCMHDEYMDWIMGFGSFWRLFAGVLAMFAPDY